MKGIILAQVLLMECLVWGADLEARQTSAAGASNASVSVPLAQATAEIAPESAENAEANPPPEPDATEKYLRQHIKDYEAKLADPKLSELLRVEYNKQIADSQTRLLDHRTNAFLWSQLDAARKSNNAKKIAACEAAVADYMANKLGALEGKQYPTGMTLAKVTSLYNAKLGIREPVQSNRGLLIASLGGGFLLAMVGYLKFKRKQPAC